MTDNKDNNSKAGKNRLGIVKKLTITQEASKSDILTEQPNTDDLSIDESRVEVTSACSNDGDIRGLVVPYKNAKAVRSKIEEDDEDEDPTKYYQSLIAKFHIILDIIEDKKRKWIEAAMKDEGITLPESIRNELNNAHYKGRFDVKLDPELYVQAVLVAAPKGLSLEEFVEETIRKQI